MTVEQILTMSHAYKSASTQAASIDGASGLHVLQVQGRNSTNAVRVRSLRVSYILVSTVEGQII